MYISAKEKDVRFNSANPGTELAALLLGILGLDRTTVVWNSKSTDV